MLFVLFFFVTKFSSALDRMRAKARVEATTIFGNLTICDALQSLLLFIDFFLKQAMLTCGPFPGFLDNTVPLFI